MNINIIYIWWFLLSTYSIYNIYTLYIYKQKINYYKLNNYKHKLINYDKSNFIACCLYTGACAIRSIFPRMDVERICLFDTVLSYPIVGRICATIGELAFIYQITLITKNIADYLDCNRIYNNMNIIKCMNIYAQLFCWFGVLYQINLMHVFEECIWMISVCYIGFCYLYFYNQVEYNIFKIIFYISQIYTFFMIFIDIPMYYHKSIKDAEVIDISLIDAIKNMSYCDVSDSYNDWKQEIPWMTGYFINGPFISLKLLDLFNL
jgi:hypothetical protein